MCFSIIGYRPLLLAGLRWSALHDQLLPRTYISGLGGPLLISAKRLYARKGRDRCRPELFRFATKHMHVRRLIRKGAKR
ncbi:hypothetical protein BCV70DRAFT_20949 [Testicularia cyperi]|uniref:Uncharacterized protein n=1 Tax=Testicularia cyperi TaxID=1882483 RepID=A0A317XZC8_9BASI|nr:hypothetical protein BCV70DRAFT_20949 [Testicularia cyperi]